MRKHACTGMLARRLGCREGRLVSLMQRATDAGLIRANVSRSPDFDVTAEELARLVLLATADEGLANAGRTIERYGQLRGVGINATLESMLGFHLSRPENVPPAHSGLAIHTGDSPSAVLMIATADGVSEHVFLGEGSARQDGIERTVRVPGSALFAIAKEFTGTMPSDVDALLQEVA